MKITEAIINQAIRDLSPRMATPAKCDPKCYKLAEHFYPHESGEFLTELAEAIQELVEDMSPSESED